MQKAVKKKAVTKKKKTTKVVLKESFKPGPSVPELKEAIICAVDEPRRWAKTGLPMSRLPAYAEEAAIRCAGTKCFFCGTKKDPVPADKVLGFHPEYPLCECLVPLRRMAFDYIERWDTPEGRKTIVDQFDAGTLSGSAEVYQYFCQPCGSDKAIVVTVREVASGLKKYKKHVRRRKCYACHQKDVTRWKAQQQAQKQVPQIASPKTGPAAKINKIKTPKRGGKEVPSLPPFEALTKASEAPAT
jgi:hypothetical protein